MISRRTIDQIFATVQIEEVVGDYVQLKRAGSGLGGLCPFHNEKTPSFKVNPTMGIYKCFGCSRGGNSVDFIMEHDKMTYPEALRFLAKKYHIEIEETQENKEEVDEKNKHRESLYIALEHAKNHFHSLLIDNDEGKRIGYSYFKERGLSDQTINDFNLGYSLNSWDAFLKDPTIQAFDKKVLLEAGLIKTRNQENENAEVSYYDAFRERVIFPINNVNGKVVGFGARQLVKSDKSPKYLNSPESEVYHKSSILYGLYESRKDIRIEDKCLLVEGYMDVVMLHQHGVKNVVASSGTSLTANQVRLIKRFTDHVTILYDGDKAGIKAALRGVDILLEGGLNAHVVLFPDGEDPDSYCKLNGGDALKEYIRKNQKDFVFFKADLLLEEYGNDPIGKTKAVREIVESIVRIYDPLKRQAYIKECSKLLDFDEELLQAEAHKLRSRKKANKRGFKEDPVQTKAFIQNVLPDVVEKDQIIAAERKLLEKLMLFGTESYQDDISVAEYIFYQLEKDSYQFASPMFLGIFNEAEQYFEENDLMDESFFINHKEIGKFAADVFSSVYLLSPKWADDYEIIVSTEKENIKEDVFANLNYLKLIKVNKALANADQELKNAEITEDIVEAQIQYLAILKVKQQLTEKMGILGANPIIKSKTQ